MMSSVITWFTADVTTDDESSPWKPQTATACLIRLHNLLGQPRSFISMQTGKVSDQFHWQNGDIILLGQTFCQRAEVLLQTGRKDTVYNRGRIVLLAISAETTNTKGGDAKSGLVSPLSAWPCGLMKHDPCVKCTDKCKVASDKRVCPGISGEPPLGLFTGVMDPCKCWLMSSSEDSAVNRFCAMFGLARTLAALIVHITHKHLCARGGNVCKPKTASRCTSQRLPVLNQSMFMLKIKSVFLWRHTQVKHHFNCLWLASSGNHDLD